MTAWRRCALLLWLPALSAAQAVAGQRVGTDDGATVMIYFPSSGTLQPQLDLNLRLDALRHRIGGTGMLDMCLADAALSQPGSLELTVWDGAGSASVGQFSVWHTDGRGDAAGRLDYRITLRHAGVLLAVQPGTAMRLPHTPLSGRRTLLLPGMPAPVSCVETPLQFITDPFLATSKRAGAYHGRLQLELRVSASQP